MTIDFDREVHDDAAEQEERHRRDLERRERAEATARTAARVAHLAAVDHGEQMSAASPLGALLQVGESAEDGFSTKDVDERMERFPELRDMEVPTGNAARFPELAGEAKAKEPEEGEEYQR